jgi:hypothetical protein
METISQNMIIISLRSLYGLCAHSTIRRKQFYEANAVTKSNG